MIAEEEVQQSEHSPGPVLDTETIRRLVFAPREINDDGSIRPEAFSIDDLQGRGWSVQRLSHLTNVVMESLVAARADRGAIHRANIDFSCLEIRNLRSDEGLQIFKVIDSALTPQELAHASVLFAQETKRSKARDFRDRLRKLCGAL